jgi:diaminohydroxyphosphoribosylaminopyrimidine deaminase/5-amino-6-(5-phosphoribosylamino)uracil reductase
VEAADPGYFHQRRTGFPRVVLKAAATLDGQVAAADGTSRWITSPEAREDVHLLRAGADAVMVGAGTVLADDPRLDVRIAGYSGPQPLPVVVVGRRPLPADRAVFQRDALVLAPAPVELPADVVAVPGQNGVDLEEGLRALAGRGILDLLVEGGPRLSASLLEIGRVERLVLYVGAMLAGGAGRPVFEGTWKSLSRARRVRIADVRRIGPDLRLDLEPEAA